jgi:hypothetical protein
MHQEGTDQKSSSRANGDVTQSPYCEAYIQFENNQIAPYLVKRYTLNISISGNNTSQIKDFTKLNIALIKSKLLIAKTFRDSTASFSY